MPLGRMALRLFPYIGWGLLVWDLWNLYNSWSPPPTGNKCENPRGTPEVWYWCPHQHCLGDFRGVWADPARRQWSSGNNVLRHGNWYAPGDDYAMPIEWWGPYTGDPGFPPLPPSPLEPLPIEVIPTLPPVLPYPIVPWVPIAVPPLAPQPLPIPRPPWVPVFPNPEQPPGPEPVIIPPWAPQPSYPPVTTPGEIPGWWENPRPGANPNPNPNPWTPPPVGANDPDVTPQPNVRPRRSRFPRPRHETKPEPVRARRPGRGTKERKLGATAGQRRALGLLASGISEGFDLLDALHDALPKEFQGKDHPNSKFKALYDHWDKVNMDEAFANIWKNQATDKYYGEFFKKVQDQLSEAGLDFPSLRDIGGNFGAFR